MIAFDSSQNPTDRLGKTFSCVLIAKAISILINPSHTQKAIEGIFYILDPDVPSYIDTFVAPLSIDNTHVRIVVLL